MEKKKIVVLTGAGMSADSGLHTFRDQGGLWENHNVYDVATPEAFMRDPDMVHRFYNMRREQLSTVSPNPGHHALSELESNFHVHIITQNVDDLHERAGSSQILHLHGELVKVRTIDPPSQIIDWGYKPLQTSDCTKQGSRLRPHIVWFGEDVPSMTEAIEICQTADHLLIVGTSLLVYPASSLVHYIPATCGITLVDPGKVNTPSNRAVKHIQKSAAEALPLLIKHWILNGVD